MQQRERLSVSLPEQLGTSVNLVTNAALQPGYQLSRRNTILGLAGAGAVAGVLYLGYRLLPNRNQPQFSHSSQVPGTTETPSTHIDGTPVTDGTPIQNIDGTATQYVRLEAQVPKGNSLLLSLSPGTQQAVGEFTSQDDMNTFIKNNAGVPLYKQPVLYPQDTTQGYILVLEQDTRDSSDLIVLAGDTQGNKPMYDCRIAPNHQVATIIGQLQRARHELQGVQPFKPPADYPFTQPTDSHFV